jgi:hypothetical protein
VALSLGLMAAALAASCKKEHESLILVAISLDAAPSIPLTSLKLETREKSVTVELEGNLSTDPDHPTVFGLYVAETGLVRVDVTASPVPGQCAGFIGSRAASINMAGDTKTIQVGLAPANVCNPTGAGGHGGGGSGGSAPPCTGTAPPSGVAPTLTCCTTYDHAELPSGQDCDDNDTYLYTSAFSPDGSLVVTGGDDGRVMFWTYDGKTLKPEGHYVSDTEFGYAAFSPDGTLVAVGGIDRVDLFYMTGTKRWTSAITLDMQGAVYGLGFTPDSQRVITLDETGNLYVHSVTQATALFQTAVPIADAFGLAVAPAAVGGVLGVAVLDASGNSAIYGLTSTAIGAPTYVDTAGVAVWAGCFSPSGSLLALGEASSYLRFHAFPLTSSTPTGADITIGGSDDVRACAFSPNGSYVAITGGRTQGSASIWGVTSRALTGRYDFTDSRVEGLSVGFAPAGNAIVVGGMGCGKVLLCRE